MSGTIRGPQGGIRGAEPVKAPTTPFVGPPAPAAKQPQAPAAAEPSAPSAAPLTAPASAAMPVPPPPADRNKTWAKPGEPIDRVLNFGHRPVDDGLGGMDLLKLHPSGVPIWSDTGTAVSADQFAAMPPEQQQRLLELLPADRRAAFSSRMAKGDAAKACVDRPGTTAPAQAPSQDEAFRAQVVTAARAATRENYHRGGACYRTAEATVAKLGGDLYSARDQIGARGRSLAHLGELAKLGKLQPGMVVYMNTSPGTDPSSTDMAHRPHWMTYLGQDAKGEMRFADQYHADWKLDEVASAYSPRVIDAVIDPFESKRAVAKPAGPKPASAKSAPVGGGSLAATVPAAAPEKPAAAAPKPALLLGDLWGGQEEFNVYELNAWLAHPKGEVDAKMVTMHEGELIAGIKARVAESGHKLKVEEVLQLSLELNHGNVSQALLTAHNAFRQLARGDIPFNPKLMRHEKFAELYAQPNFFTQYLDGRSIGLGDHPVDPSGAWYHTFVTATIGFVGARKGNFDSAYELFSAKDTHLDSTAAAMVGQALQAIPLNFMPATASLDAFGEQAVGLIRSRGIAKDVADEVRGEATGLMLSGLLAKVVKD